MKRNKFMEFLNDKGKYAAVFAFIVVAGICAGTAAYNKGVTEKNDSAEKNNTVSEPVLTNKNAGGVKTEQKQEEPVKTKENEITETKPQENTAVLDSEDGADDFEIALTWPIQGDILMGYSPDTLVYDPTLDQYRTNDSVYIAAETGSNVSAAADGIVAEVNEDETRGNYVVIEHDNGWATTYGQLADINVAAGDAVSSGEVLGTVAEPSIYSSAMGTHVEFAVTLDDMSVDPEIAVG